MLTVEIFCTVVFSNSRKKKTKDQRPVSSTTQHRFSGLWRLLLNYALTLVLWTIRGMLRLGEWGGERKRARKEDERERGREEIFPVSRPKHNWTGAAGATQARHRRRRLASLVADAAEVLRCCWIPYHITNYWALVPHAYTQSAVGPIERKKRELISAWMCCKHWRCCSAIVDNWAVRRLRAFCLSLTCRFSLCIYFCSSKPSECCSMMLRCCVQ